MSVYYICALLLGGRVGLRKAEARGEGDFKVANDGTLSLQHYASLAYAPQFTRMDNFRRLMSEMIQPHEPEADAAYCVRAGARNYSK